jgi:hypothetical protein
MSGLPTHKEDFAGVDVIFSGETCADAWIEKEARKNDLFTPKACSNRRLYENNC